MNERKKLYLGTWLRCILCYLQQIAAPGVISWQKLDDVGTVNAAMTPFDIVMRMKKGIFFVLV
jgi:hypothetical protein